jgi:hypothetical protein
MHSPSKRNEVSSILTCCSKTKHMKTVKWLKQTCGACPEAYEGELETGESIYIRCRWGYGYIRIDDVTVAEVNYEDNYQGLFDSGDVAKMFKEADIEWDENFDVIEWDE